MMKGTLRKLKTKHEDIIQYSLDLVDQEKSQTINLNELIGKKITLSFTGNKYCIDTHPMLFLPQR